MGDERQGELMTLTATLSPRAQSLLGESLIWDNHGCMPMRPKPEILPQLERYKAAGVDIVGINAGYGTMDWDSHVSLLNFMREWLQARPDQYLLVHTPDDIMLAKRSGRLGVFFDVEGMVPVQDDPSRVHQLYSLGVRWMLVAYNRSNAAGSGCLDEDGGLTAVGRRIIDEMDEAGMLVCLSHSGARTAREALEHSRNPVILSHSNPRAVADHPRNVSDALMRACAEKGGVIGLNGIGPFLGTDVDLVPMLLRHIEYVLDLVGPEHVGLGLDYVFDCSDFEEDIDADPDLQSPGISSALAMVEPEAMPEIVEGLCRIGLSDSAVRGVLGENWLRVARQVWK